MREWVGSINTLVVITKVIFFCFQRIIRRIYIDDIDFSGVCVR